MLFDGPPIARSNTLVAATCALLASAILSFIDNFVFTLSQEAGLWQFQVFRSLFAVPILLVVARFSGQALRPQNLPRLMGRSVAVSTGLLIYFAALGALSVPQAGAGLFSAPIWVLILSAVLFKTGLSWRQLAVMVLGFCGALLVLGLDPNKVPELPLYPLLAGFFYGFGMLLTRHWCAEESPITLAIGIFVTLGVVSLIALCITTIWSTSNPEFITMGWVIPTPRFLGLTLFQAVGALVAVSLIAQAYRIANPSFVAVFEYSFLVFASLWTLLLWGKATSVLAWVGIALIVVSGVLMLGLERRPSKQPTLPREAA